MDIHNSELWISMNRNDDDDADTDGGGGGGVIIKNTIIIVYISEIRYISNTLFNTIFFILSPLAYEIVQ